MARQHGHGSLAWVSNIEDADEAIDARGRDELRAVFIPVVGEGFGRGHGAVVVVLLESGIPVVIIVLVVGRGVQGDGSREVVCGRGRGAEVEEAEVGVRGDGGEDGGGMWGEGGGVGARVGGEGDEGIGAVGRPLFFFFFFMSALSCQLSGFLFFFLFRELEVEQYGEGVSGVEEKRREDRRDVRS